jgi:iron-sulfur cluster repair protein YtfE (RIC family)
VRTAACESPGAPHLRFRRRRVLRRIAAQHLRLDEMADAVVRAIEEAVLVTARTSLARFAEAMCAHFAMEEDVDFPALLVLNPELREPLRCLSADHSQLVEDLAAVDEMLAQAPRADAHRAFDQLVIVMGSHELREERLLDSVT